MPHPRVATLSRHADGAAPGPRLAAHLLRCPRCRAAVDEMRALAESARAAPVPLPAPDALERILARRAAGERVLLPADPAPAARPRVARRGVLVAAAVLVLAAG
ncbi:MAG TPA: hypothetical protein VFJ82_13925, partial [Longimicrobium sp.]|nr:hypothetical protein [Longimicrobium sp.]